MRCEGEGCVVNGVRARLPVVGLDLKKEVNAGRQKIAAISLRLRLINKIFYVVDYMAPFILACGFAEVKSASKFDRVALEMDFLEVGRVQAENA